MQPLTLLQEEAKHVTLNISDLVTLENSGIPGGDFAMRELDENHIQNLVDSDRSKWPAIKVAATNIGPVIVDGGHRVEAALRQGAATIDAILQSYKTPNDVIEAAFRANLSHGLKASAETRGDYAYWLFVTYPGITQNEIATRAQIRQPTVSSAIAKREALLRDKALEDMGAKEEFDIEQVCKKFSKRTLKFFSEVSALSDEDLVHLIQSSVKPGERNKLARVGQLLVHAYGS